MKHAPHIGDLDERYDYTDFTT